jgi:hypothetical protein
LEAELGQVQELLKRERRARQAQEAELEQKAVLTAQKLLEQYEAARQERLAPLKEKYGGK